jgi:glucose/mannose-6-phosphate isomerase
MSLINLDYTGNFNRFDTENMYRQIISLPDQIEETYFKHLPSELAQYYKNIKNIVICGMGGSAIAGDIVKTLFEDKIPIRVIKDYNIPNYIDNSSLGIVCSYSGNTEETIACFEALKNAGAQIAMVSSGGILKHFSDEEYLIKIIPTGFQPRAAIGYLFFSVVKILEELELIPDQKINVRLSLLNLRNKLRLITRDVLTVTNLAKQMAIKVYRKAPVIYSSSPRFYPLAYRFKCQCNENAKNHAFCNTFSEMNHNEIEGWESRYNLNLIPIFIRDFKEEKHYLNRLQALQNIFKKEKIEFLGIYTDGKTLMGKMFSTILLCDMITYYLAILNRVNPSAINYIDYLKKTI